jgi:hypothetical protein
LLPRPPSAVPYRSSRGVCAGHAESSSIDTALTPRPTTHDKQSELYGHNNTGTTTERHQAPHATARRHAGTPERVEGRGRTWSCSGKGVGSGGLLRGCRHEQARTDNGLSIAPARSRDSPTGTRHSGTRFCRLSGGEWNDRQAARASASAQPPACPEHGTSPGDARTEGRPCRGLGREGVGGRARRCERVRRCRRRRCEGVGCTWGGGRRDRRRVAARASGGGGTARRPGRGAQLQSESSATPPITHVRRRGSRARLQRRG